MTYRIPKGIPFAQVPVFALEADSLHPLDKLIYARLCGYAGAHGRATVLLSTLKRTAGRSERQIQRSLGRLETEGFVEITRRRNRSSAFRPTLDSRVLEIVRFENRQKRSRKGLRLPTLMTPQRETGDAPETSPASPLIQNLKQTSIKDGSSDANGVRMQANQSDAETAKGSAGKEEKPEPEDNLRFLSWDPLLNELQRLAPAPGEPALAAWLTNSMIGWQEGGLIPQSEPLLANRMVWLALRRIEPGTLSGAEDPEELLSLIENLVVRRLEEENPGAGPDGSIP